MRETLKWYSCRKQQFPSYPIQPTSSDFFLPWLDQKRCQIMHSLFFDVFWNVKYINFIFKLEYVKTGHPLQNSLYIPDAPFESWTQGAEPMPWDGFCAESSTSLHFKSHSICSCNLPSLKFAIGDSQLKSLECLLLIHSQV